MKCQILFSEKNIINLSSAALAKRVVKVKMNKPTTFGNSSSVSFEYKPWTQGLYQVILKSGDAPSIDLEDMTRI